MNLALSAPSNDNNILDLCAACEEHAARRQGICGRCEADVSAHLDAERAYYFGDAEGECYAAGLNPDPRY